MYSKQFCFGVLIPVTSEPLVFPTKIHSLGNKATKSMLKQWPGLGVFSLLICIRSVKGGGCDCGEMSVSEVRVPVLHKLVGCLLMEVKAAVRLQSPAFCPWGNETLASLKGGKKKTVKTNLYMVNLVRLFKTKANKKQLNTFSSFYRKILIVIQCSTFYSKYTITNLA